MACRGEGMASGRGSKLLAPHSNKLIAIDLCFLYECDRHIFQCASVTLLVEIDTDYFCSVGYAFRGLAHECGFETQLLVMEVFQ